MVSAYPQPNREDEHEVQHKDSDVHGFQCPLGKHVPQGGHRGAAGGLHGFLCRPGASLP